jgi:membrane protein YdbS with pleckstrin-like domain
MLSSTATTVDVTSSGAGLSGPYRIGISAVVIIVILLTIISILATAFLVKWRSWKKQKQATDIIKGEDNALVGCH